MKTLTYPDNETISYNYDAGGKLSSIPGYVSYADYTAIGRPGIVTFGDGVHTGYTYYPQNGRLWSSTTGKEDTIYASLTYNYFADGNVHHIVDQLNDANSQDFLYDGVNRLIQAQSVSYGTRQYSYDQIGNILSKEGVTYSYQQCSPDAYPPCSKPHKLVSVVDGTGTRAFTHDNNGNITSDGLRTIWYDYDNMPKTITKDGVTTNFVYDGNGTRVKKITPNYTITYIDKLHECVNGECGNYIIAGDTRIALKASTRTIYYHPDHLGSTTVVTDATGSKVEDVAYYPFGTTRSKAGTANVNHLFTGQEFDATTGLYNYNARMYDSDLGRFITPDSIISDPTNPQSFNRYSYTSNNPLNLVDPTGHAAYDDDWPSTDWGLSDFADRPGGGYVPVLDVDAELRRWREVREADSIPSIEMPEIVITPENDSELQKTPEMSQPPVSLGMEILPVLSIGSYPSERLQVAESRILPRGFWLGGGSGGKGTFTGTVIGATIGGAVGNAIGSSIGMKIGLRVGGSIGLGSGPMGSLGGAIAGGITGGVVGGQLGGFLGGRVGAWIGHMVDQRGSGELH